MTLDLPHVTLYLALWGAIGPLAGILVGHYLTRSWQQQQWKMDRRKEEFRELLTSLSESIAAEMRIDRHKEVPTSKNMKVLEELQSQCFRVIHDRIFIAADVARLNISERWIDAFAKHKEASGSIGAFVEVYVDITQDIVKVATTQS